MSGRTSPTTTSDPVSCDRGERILVVDDEESIADIVSTVLRYQGYSVETASSGREAVRKSEEWRPHLIVLDVMLPDLDGYGVAAELRKRRLDIPIVFLSARGETADRLEGLRLGADDYLAKPFSVEELVMRIQAVLRRTQRVRQRETLMQFADLEIDEDAHEVHRGTSRIELSPTEFKLLRFLTINARRVVSRSQILEHVWDFEFDGESNIVETYIKYLRRKVDAGREPLIHTVRGAGYVMRRAEGAAGRETEP